MLTAKSIGDATKESLAGNNPEAIGTADIKPAPPSIDEGDPATKDDGSGTNETD